MKGVGYFLGACIVLALLRAALAVMVVAALLGIIAGLFYRPAETFGLLVFLLVASLANDHGGALLVIIGLGIASTIIVPRRG